MQNKDQEFIQAISVGRDDIVRSLLDLGSNPNAVDQFGFAALHMACQMGNITLVNLLLEAGADVKSVDKHGRTPLHLACYGGVQKIILKLIEAGANLNVQCSKGWTPLHATVELGNCLAAKILIEHKIKINAVDHQGNTPLHLACVRGNQLMAAFLIEHGADITLENRIENQTPLHIASERGDIGMLSVLSELSIDMNISNANFETPLHTACLYNQVESARFLISLGIDLELQSKFFGTPYQIACQYERVEIAKLLIAAGVKHSPSEDKIISRSEPINNPNRMFKSSKIIWRNESCPENFERDYSDLLDFWKSMTDKGVKRKCCAMLYAYINGLGWRNHRELCQLIYQDLSKVHDTPEKIYEFFKDKLNDTQDDSKYRQDGGFIRTLLFCRYAIVSEMTKPRTTTSLYSDEIFCALM